MRIISVLVAHRASRRESEGRFFDPNSNRPNNSDIRKNPFQGPLKYMLLIVLLLAVTFVLANQNGNVSDEKSYSELLTLIENDQIDKVAIQSNTLVAHLVNSRYRRMRFRRVMT